MKNPLFDRNCTTIRINPDFAKSVLVVCSTGSKPNDTAKIIAEFEDLAKAQPLIDEWCAMRPGYAERLSEYLRDSGPTLTW